MSEIVSKIRSELESASNTTSGFRIKNGDVCKISAKAFRGLRDRSRDYVFAICEELLEQRDWPTKVIAFDFAHGVRKQYDESAVFERWLERYVRSRGDCGDFCTHAFGELICQHTELARKTLTWTQREEFRMRRAAAVVLIPSIRRTWIVQ